MFINKQIDENRSYYEKMLRAAGSLSNLFSSSQKPYLGYRIVENLFCRSFDAKNLSRSDCSVDAAKQQTGIGIKTFLYKNNYSFEKVAEFNRQLDLFKNLSNIELINKVADLRNERINFTKRNYNLNTLLYHCIVRDTGKIQIHENSMDLIRINSIKNVTPKGNIITFRDDINEYKFNIAKSTLFKQFKTDKPTLEFQVKIISNPYKILEELFEAPFPEIVTPKLQKAEHIYLPLYSGDLGEKLVHSKSGLNQWNASGRSRDPDEIYIPIPSWIHQKYPKFFPPRDTSFDLLLPNGQKLSAKVCQDNSKALMTNPNAALGKWLLRDILNLKPKELLNYERLESIGLDSVVIFKKSENQFEIDFSKIGSYEEFKGTNSLEEDFEDS